MSLLFQEAPENPGEQLQQTQTQQTRVGGIFDQFKQMYKSWVLGQMMGKNKAPTYQDLGGAQDAAVRMPWEQDAQKISDSYGKFFEKMDNPQFEKTFQQLLTAMFPQKDYRR